MQRIRKVVALGAIASFAVVGPAIANGNDNHGPNGGNGNGNGKGEVAYSDADGVYTYQCSDNHFLEFDGPALLWPPNHRQVDFTVAAYDTHDENNHDTVTLVVTTTTNDDSATESDFGATADGDPALETGGTSGNGRAESEAYVVRERAGYTNQYEGRVYTLQYDAMFSGTNGDDEECQAEFNVVVPHDMRPANRTAADQEGWDQS